MTAFEWKTFFVWRVTYIWVHVTQARILPTSSKHVSVGMQFLRLGIGGLSHQSCMSLHIGTNNIVGGSINSSTYLQRHPLFICPGCLCFVRPDLHSCVTMCCARPMHLRCYRTDPCTVCLIHLNEQLFCKRGGRSLNHAPTALFDRPFHLLCVNCCNFKRCDSC